jgi:hypothetical protein
MQIAQPSQERMKRRLQRAAGIAFAAGLGVVAPLQVRAGAERTARAGDDQTTHLVAAILDGIERLGQSAQHVDRHRVHHLLMIERENRY